MVGHEAVLERVCGRLHKDPGEEVVEEVWVLADRLLEAADTVGGLRTDAEILLAGWKGSLRSVKSLELLQLDLVVIAIPN